MLQTHCNTLSVRNMQIIQNFVDSTSYGTLMHLCMHIEDDLKEE